MNLSGSQYPNSLIVMERGDTNIFLFFEFLFLFLFSDDEEACDIAVT